MLPVGADVEVYRYLHIMYERSRRKKRTRARDLRLLAYRRYLHCCVTERTDQESDVRMFDAENARAK